MGSGSCRLRRSGFSFDPESPKSLSSALNILESLPLLREIMGKESRRIVEKFSCANFAANALAAARTALGLSTGCKAEAEPCIAFGRSQ
jgi:glycosyltransferase involved in cell wall biosynthesis